MSDGSALSVDGRGTAATRLLARTTVAGERSSSFWCLEYEGGGPEGVDDFKLTVSANDRVLLGPAKAGVAEAMV
jgi:hypothetical protein